MVQRGRNPNHREGGCGSTVEAESDPAITQVKRGRSSPVAIRRMWQRYMDSTRFVFLDETGTTTTMTRRYGWAPKGERVIDATPWGHWKVTTFGAGLRASGLIAAMMLDGPMTG